MSKRSKTTVSRHVRKVSSASYKAYYGITLIETLMSVGLLGVVLLPLLMTSTAYLSTKLLNNRSKSELSQNVNSLGAKLNTLAASTTGVNHLASSATNLEMRIKTSTGARRIFRYSIIGAPGAQRLREFQGSTGNVTSTAAMRSLNEDSITLIGNTGFVYCNDTTCTTPANSLAVNQTIARTAETVVFDGNTATDVVRVGSGVVTGAEPVALLFNAGDNSRKRMFLPSNTLALGTDPIVAQAGFQPSPDVSNTELAYTGTTTNQTPFGLIKVVTKQEAYGTPIGGGAVNADLRLTTGNDSSFTALPLNTNTPVDPIAPILNTNANFSRVYKEGAGTIATGNVRPILPNFKLDQTVADSFAGNMCFSGNRGLDNAFQVYYWNRTMEDGAALTSVQSASTVADPFALTPECQGARPGYDAYDPNQGEYYVTTPTRKAWGVPTTTTKTAPDSYTYHTSGTVRWHDHLNPGRIENYQYASGYVANTSDGYSDGSNRYYFGSGTAGDNNTFLGIGAWWGHNRGYYTANNLGPKAVPQFAWNPNTLGITDADHTIGAADNAGQPQYQVQPVDPFGTHVLIHERGNDGYIAKPVNEIDPSAGNSQRNLYLRRLQTFAAFGTDGGDNNTTCRNKGLNQPTVAADHPFNRDFCSDLYNNPANDFWWRSDPANTTVTYKITNVNNYQTWESKPWLRISGSISAGNFYATSITDVNHPERILNADNFLSLSIGDNPTSSNLFTGSPVWTVTDADGNPPGHSQYDSGCDCYIFVPDPPTYNLGGWCDLTQDAADPTVYGCMYGTPLPGDINGADYRYRGANVGSKGHVSQRNAFERSEYARVTVRNYLNPDPTVAPAIDTINIPLGAEAPFIIRDDSSSNTADDYLFYSKQSPDTTTRLYRFHTIVDPMDSTKRITKMVVGPQGLNNNWGTIATSQLAAGKRVLSYSPNNKLAITGNTSTFGNVVAWYYDDVDLPISMTRKGGMGFNSTQANSPIVNYIAQQPDSTEKDIISNNLASIAAEGNMLYTFNRVTGMVTGYGSTVGTQNYSRQNHFLLEDGVEAGAQARSAIAISPMDNGLYLLRGTTVRYYDNRRVVPDLTPNVTSVPVATTSTKGTLAGAYARILADHMRDFEALRDPNKNNLDNVASFDELTDCANACTDIIVKEAAAYFVNNYWTVFRPMETISDPNPNNVFHVNDLTAYRDQQEGLNTPVTTTNRLISYNIPTQPVSRTFSTPQATTPTGLAVSKATGLVYVLDSTIGTVTVGVTVTRTLNIHVYNPNGTFIETLALNVTDDQFVNAADRLVPQSGQIMRLTLDEKKSQFYVHVENNGRIYQFGVERQI